MTTYIAPQLLDPSTLTMLRDTNRLINGDMRIDQRNGGGSITVTAASVFCVDRFRAGMSGANGTGQRVACSLTGFPFMLQLTGTGSTTSAWIGQMVESFNCTSLVGQKVTVQFRAASSNVTTLAVNLKSATATDNFTSTNLVESRNVTITSTLTYYELTFNATMPASVANGIYLEFVTGSNLGTGTLQMTGVQLEAGVKASPFAFRQYSDELALCQRYYYKATSVPLGVTLNVSDGYAAIVRFPRTMRVAPTLEAGAAYSVGSGSAGTPTISASNVDAARMSNGASNWTVNVTVSLTAGFVAEIT